MHLPRAFARIVARVAKAAGIDEPRVADILLGAPAPREQVDAIAGALRTVRDQDPDPEARLLLRGLQPKVAA
jgi:hypothetical protein